jgi:hypothetical protein
LHFSGLAEWAKSEIRQAMEDLSTGLTILRFGFMLSLDVLQHRSRGERAGS